MNNNSPEETADLPYLMLYDEKKEMTAPLLSQVRQGYRIFAQRLSQVHYLLLFKSTESTLMTVHIEGEPYEAIVQSLAPVSFDNKRCNNPSITHLLCSVVKMHDGCIETQPTEATLTAEKMAIIRQRPALTEWEASHYINMSRAFLRRDRMNGALKDRTLGPNFVQFNGNIRYLRSELDQWLLAHQVVRQDVNEVADAVLQPQGGGVATAQSGCCDAK